MSNVIPEPKIFTCTNSMVLGKKIAASYGIPLGNVITSTYSDGEFQPSFEESDSRNTRIFNWFYQSRSRKFNGIIADARRRKTGFC